MTILTQPITHMQGLCQTHSCQNLKRVGFLLEVRMKRLNVFITKKEKKHLEAQKGLECCTFGGPSFKPIGNPQEMVENLRVKYKMPEGTGIDLSNGEFCSP